MKINFRKPKIGMVHLLLLNNSGEEAEKKAFENFYDAKKYLEDNLGVEVITNTDAVTDMDIAIKTWKYFKEKEIDSLIFFSTLFNLGNIVSEIAANLDVPYLLWGLEESLIDKGIIGGSMISIMPTGSILMQLKRKFSFAYGTVKSGLPEDKVKEFVDVTRAIAYMRSSTVGLIGARPDGFELSNFDEMSIKRIFGTTITKISMYHFMNEFDKISEKDIDQDMKIQQDLLEIDDKDVMEARSSSRSYLAVKKIVKDYGINAYAPQCWPELRMERKAPICTANGRMSVEGIMGACEVDMDCALTMLLLHSLAGTAPWNADFVNLVKDKEALIFWHCGNASYNLYSKKPKMERVFEGLAQGGTLKPGTVTICRINHVDCGFKIVAGIGEAIEAKQIFKGSNILVQMRGGNMEYIETMLENGIPHHNIIIYGDLSEKIKSLANFLNIPAVIKK